MKQQGAYTFLLLQLANSVLLLLLFVLFVLQLLVQVEEFNTLAHGLSPHLQHAQTNTCILFHIYFRLILDSI